MIEQVIELCGAFVDSVDVEWRDSMLLVNWQIKRFAIDLACARKNNPSVRIEFATGFKQFQLSGAIQFQIGLGIQHRSKMTNVAGKIKYLVLSTNQTISRVRIAGVCLVQSNAVLDLTNIVKITALARNQGIDNTYLDVAESVPAYARDCSR